MDDIKINTVLTLYFLLLFLYDVDDAGGVSRQMANWLKNASTVSAPNPYQRQIFRGGKAKGVRNLLFIIPYI